MQSNGGGTHAISLYEAKAGMKVALVTVQQTGDAKKHLSNNPVLKKACRLLTQHLKRNNYGVADIDSNSMKRFEKVK